MRLGRKNRSYLDRIHALYPDLWLLTYPQSTCRIIPPSNWLLAIVIVHLIGQPHRESINSAYRVYLHTALLFSTVTVAIENDHQSPSPCGFLQIPVHLEGGDATLVLLTDLHHHPSYDAAVSAKCLCRADAAKSPPRG